MQFILPALVTLACLHGALSMWVAPPCEYTFATAKLPDPCPEISYITNVNIDWTIGLYYVHYANSDYLCENGCVIDNATTICENTYSSTISCLKGCQGSDIGSPYIYYQDLNNLGVFLPVTEGEGIPFYILDYSPEFTIYYNCEATKCGERNEGILVESLQSELSCDTINRIRGTLSANGIDLTTVVELPRAPDCLNVA